MWELQIAKRAQRKVERFPRRDRERIIAALDEMQSDPFAGELQQLKTSPIRFRRRVGPYRIIFRLEPETSLVIVSAIDRRTTTTYRRR